MGTASPAFYCMPSGSEIKDVNMEWCVTGIDEVKKIHHSITGEMNKKLGLPHLPDIIGTPISLHRLQVK
jgi:hypothetical protein